VGPNFEPGVPWLLRQFDQLCFHEVEADELPDLRQGVRAGTHALRIEPTTFSLGAHQRFLAEEAPSIADHLCAACADHFTEVRRGLDESGVAYTLDPRLVRGLDYYTRTTFEWIAVALGSAQATVNAGGRYDGLAETLGGQATPGIGWAMGVDRVLLAIEAEGLAPPPPRGPACFVVAIGEDAEPAGGALVRELREAGVSCVRAFEARPLKAQLKQADRAGATFAAILGERELTDGTVTLRRLADGIQKTVPSAEVVRWLTRLDDWTEHA